MNDHYIVFAGTLSDCLLFIALTLLIVLVVLGILNERHRRRQLVQAQQHLDSLVAKSQSKQP